MRKLFQLDLLMYDDEHVEIIKPDKPIDPHITFSLTIDTILYSGTWFYLPEHCFKYYVDKIVFENDITKIYVKEE